jgi:iron complex transport system permease protein
MFARMQRPAALLVLLAVLTAFLFLLDLAVGSVTIPLVSVWRALVGGAVPDEAWRTIVLGVRLPEAVTAAVAGASLAASGLLMQTLFRNPLAGPSVLGITSGSGLGVALVMLAAPWWTGWLPVHAALALAAFLGAMAMLLLILLADRRVGDGVTLLIVGLMAGYLCAAFVSVLELAASAQALKGFVNWGFGSFGQVSNARLPWLVAPCVAGLLAAFTLVKPLDALLLGDVYARSLGVPVKAVRRAVIVVTAVLAGTVTACCGPIAFLGLATPHVARGLWRSASHATLLPVTVLLGALLALLCDAVVRWSAPETALPLNAVTSMLGVPVVLWVLWKGQRWARA